LIAHINPGIYSFIFGCFSFAFGSFGTVSVSQPEVYGLKIHPNIRYVSWTFMLPFVYRNFGYNADAFKQYLPLAFPLCSPAACQCTQPDESKRPYSMLLKALRKLCVLDNTLKTECFRDHCCRYELLLAHAFGCFSLLDLFGI